MSYHFHLIMSPLQPPMGFIYKMLFSAKLLSSANITSLSKIFDDLIQLQSFNLDFQTTILKPTQKKCKKREWELNWVFQKVWITKLPWVEAMVGCDGKLNMVHYKICSELDGREKLSVLKFDNLQKHASRKKCNVVGPKLTMGQYFMFTNSQHAKNERLWTSRGQNIIVEMVASFSETSEKKPKFVQFVAIFQLLKLGKPLIDFELFNILKVKITLCKHQSNSIGW